MPGRVRDIAIGKIAGPVGIRGELKVVVLTDFPERFEAGRRLTLKFADDSRREVEVGSARSRKGGMVLKFNDVDSRTDAEALRDAEIVIDETDLTELGSDEFYVFDIIGLKVVTTDGRELGEVEEVLQSGANDVYVTSGGVCIPALKDVVEKIDPDAGVMVIRPVPGLLREK